MKSIQKRVQDLIPTDLEIHPVWEFDLEQEGTDDMLVKPVKDIPVTNLANRVVGTRVRLANGSILWAMLGNIDLANVERTRQFRTISIFQKGQWFFVARYHDYDYEEHGPLALANCLGLTSHDVFPIVYDIRPYCVGEANVVVDSIDSQPSAKLSQDELGELYLA